MPRPRIRYLRHRRFARLRYGRGVDFFADQSTKFAATTTAITTSAITAGTNTFTSAAHGLADGNGPYQVATGGTLPTGLTDTTLYYAGAVDANDFKLYPTAEDAINDTNEVAISDAGTGNMDLNVATSEEGLFRLMSERGVSSDTLFAETDIDNI